MATTTEGVQVSKKDLVDLFIQLDYKNAGSWGEERLVKEVEELVDLVKEEGYSVNDNERLQGILDSLVESDGAVTIAPEDEEEEEEQQQPSEEEVSEEQEEEQAAEVEQAAEEDEQKTKAKTKKSKNGRKTRKAGGKKKAAKKKDRVSRLSPEADGMEFEFHDVGTKAVAKQENGQFVVQAGSTLRKNGSEKSWTFGIKLRESMIEEGKIGDSPDDNFLEFKEDVPFSSVSKAGAIIAGRNTNGRVRWFKKGTKTTYAEIGAADDSDQE